MLNKFTYRLLFVASLFLLSTSTQVLAAEKSDSMVNTATISEKISINQASDEQLASIKGIGNKKAQAIVAYREENGAFLSLEDLLDVKGIGKGTLQKIIPFISL